MDKKRHKPHYQESDDCSNYKKNRLQELENDVDLDFNDELDEELYLEVKHLLKRNK